MNRNWYQLSNHETLLMFRLNVSVFIRAKDEDRNIQSNVGKVFRSVCIRELSFFPMLSPHWPPLPAYACIICLLAGVSYKLANQLYANSLETRLAVSGCHHSLLKYPESDQSKIWGIIMESACFWCTTRSSGVTPEKGVSTFINWFQLKSKPYLQIWGIFAIDIYPYPGFYCESLGSRV